MEMYVLKYILHYSIHRLSAQEFAIVIALAGYTINFFSQEQFLKREFKTQQSKANNQKYV